MKITTSDLLSILRQFRIADDSHVPRNIDQIKQSHPNPINQLVKFRFNRHHFYVLLDETAEDRASYIMEQIYTADSNVQGEILENPISELTTYGLPFKGKDVYLFQQVDSKKRLDVLLAERYPETSRSTWQKHIKAGHIAVNGTPAKNARQEITAADHIAISTPDHTDFSKHDLPIVYIDDDVIVINKPAGVLTHSKGALNDEFTVADFFRRYTTVGLDTNRPGIVHRLDRDTSGLIIGARTPESFDLLKSQFASRKTKKDYIAIVDGSPKQQHAKIDIQIGRNPSAPSTFRADSKGKSAITDYRVLDQGDDKSLVALHPLTGRTHQLRVHMQYLGTPITGDRVYGKPSDRLYLHAYRLEATTAPGSRKTFIAPIPTKFGKYFPKVNQDVASI
jgi:pseudouridine synthase, rluA family